MREKEKKSARERECVCVCDARVSARVCLCVCVCVCVRERERARARERKSESARARERDRERGVQIKKLLPGREWRKREFLTHCRIKISQRKSDRRGSTSSITSAKRTSQPCLSTSSEIDSAEAWDSAVCEGTGNSLADFDCELSGGGRSVVSTMPAEATVRGIVRTEGVAASGSLGISMELRCVTGIVLLYQNSSSSPSSSHTNLCWCIKRESDRV